MKPTRGRPKKGEIKDKHVSSLIQLYADGLGLFPLADFYEVTPGEVRRVLISNNVTIRPRGRPKKGEKNVA